MVGGPDMKPLLLKMHNIGPFRDETLDFTQLDNMFLIYGNTGAGKTSVFDAMTYALYGVLNGSRKGNVRAFRSDFVSAEELSFVEFTFELAYTKYRVYRTLPQSYTTRNGTVSEKAAAVSLESGADGSAFAPFNGNIAETNGRIEEIIGLNAAEFSRIVLLPQGAFADFLHESSKDRRDTLEKLFPVDSYTAVIDEVKTLAEENTRQLDTIAAQITACAEKYNQETAAGELKALLKQQKELEKSQKGLMKKLPELSAEKEKLAAKHAAALQNENNRKHLEELKTKSLKISETKERLTRASEAAKLSEYIHVAAQNEKNKMLCTAAVKTAEQYAARAQQELSLLAAQKDAYEAQKKAAEEADAALPQQRNRLMQIKQLAELRAKAERTKTAENQAEKERQAAASSAETTFTAFLGAANRVSADLREDMTVAQILSLLSSAEQTARSSWNDAQVALKNAQIREELSSELRAAEKSAEQSAGAYELAQQYAVNTKKCVGDLENRLELQKQNNAACYLADSLADGKPCPVCGSLSHPSPVQPLPESLDLQTKLDTTRHSLELAQNDAGEKLQQKARAQKHLEEKQIQLTEAEEAPAVAEAQKELAGAAKKYKAVSEAFSEAARLADTYQSLQQRIQSLTQQFSSVKSEAASAQASFLQLADTIRGEPNQELPDERTLSAEIAKLEKISGDGRTAYAKWSDSFTEAGKQSSSAQARFEELSRQLAAAVKSADESADTLSSHLSQTSFKTSAEAESALIPDEEQRMLEQSVDSYEDEVKKYAALLENAEQTDSCAELKAQIQQAENEIQKTQDELEQTGKTIQDVGGRYKTLQSYIGEKAALETKRTELEKKAAPYKMLYSDLSGKNPKNIPFNSWALGMYFEQVVQYANTRFNRISNGRFTFKVSSDKNQGGGYKGLDLFVTDTFTGSDRDTSTLSGGETFMASISLALALTDIVQNRNGGVRLDSLFIDEGFGTLDEETLDCAITALNNLQETKMVGIISHVESMKTAVPSQVEIVKTAEGSHIKLH